MAESDCLRGRGQKKKKDTSFTCGNMTQKLNGMHWCAFDGIHAFWPITKANRLQRLLKLMFCELVAWCTDLDGGWGFLCLWGKDRWSLPESVLVGTSVWLVRWIGKGGPLNRLIAKPLSTSLARNLAMVQAQRGQTGGYNGSGIASMPRWQP